MNVGLIGAGRIGRIHAENIAAHIPRVTITRIADIAPEKARAWARDIGVTQVSADAAEVLGDPAIGAVIVCSSTDTHAAMVSAAAAKGKHVFCEKPVDLTIARARTALAAAKKAGVKVQVGFNRRFDHNVATKSEIYRIMSNLARDGKAIILISSEMQEILAMSDRIMVMHEGRTVGEIGRGQATQEKILHMATGEPLGTFRETRYY
jgi:NAD-dependent oxidoreductase involved in siderophore biosynthesis